MTQRIVFIKEAAEMAGVSPTTIDRWRKMNLFPPTISMKGGKRRWLASDIETFLASQSTLTQMPTARKQRRSAKAFTARQDATDQALERFQGKGGAK